MEIHNNEYTITTDNNNLNLTFIHNFLTHESDWSRGISYNTVKTSIENSLNFGLFHNGQQIGFARVISDFATIAYVGDIFILKAYRGLKLSKWLMEVIMSHRNLQGLRRWILLTDTADWLYKKYGFTQLPNPEIYMEKHNPKVYQQ